MGWLRNYGSLLIKKTLEKLLKKHFSETVNKTWKSKAIEEEKEENHRKQKIMEDKYRR